MVQGRRGRGFYVLKKEGYPAEATVFAVPKLRVPYPFSLGALAKNPPRSLLSVAAYYDQGPHPPAEKSLHLSLATTHTMG